MEALEEGTLPSMISGVLERTFLVHSTIDGSAAARMKLSPNDFYLCGGVVDNMLKKGYRNAEITQMCELLFTHRSGPRQEAWPTIWKELRLENSGVNSMRWPELESLLIMIEIPRAQAHLEFLQRVGEGNSIQHATQFEALMGSLKGTAFGTPATQQQARLQSDYNRVERIILGKVSLRTCSFILRHREAERLCRLIGKLIWEWRTVSLAASIMWQASHYPLLLYMDISY